MRNFGNTNSGVRSAIDCLGGSPGVACAQEFGMVAANTPTTAIQLDNIFAPTQR
ncbi:MAG: hypothetical protein DHS20C02_04820 [Micavibrio sp.]|nr:MAG: hypothetical protein DHS20C02_04820 [Micavibrio sp.]